jgi:hypothetical protein
MGKAGLFIVGGDEFFPLPVPVAAAWTGLSGREGLEPLEPSWKARQTLGTTTHSSEHSIRDAR